MLFDPPLVPGVLLRRHKRFLADVRLPSGEQVRAHCPNSGRMTQCAEPGFAVRMQPSDNPRRRCPYTLASEQRAGGLRSVLLFLVQRAEGPRFRPAEEIDPAYAESLRAAWQAGVEVLAYRARVTPDSITLGPAVPVALS